MRHDDWVTIQ